MTQYAQYDPTVPAPSPVIGWYDTGVLAYPNLPPLAALIAVPGAIWANRVPGPWAVSAGAIVAYTPPPPVLTVAQQAGVLLSEPVNIVCTSLPALDGAYAADQTSQAQITSIASAIAAGLGLPGGGATFDWYDSTGSSHPWPATQFTALAKAVMNFVYAANQVAMGNGTTLPSQTLTIA